MGFYDSLMKAKSEPNDNGIDKYAALYKEFIFKLNTVLTYMRDFTCGSNKGYVIESINDYNNDCLKVIIASSDGFSIHRWLIIVYKVELDLPKSFLANLYQNRQDATLSDSKLLLRFMYLGEEENEQLAKKIERTIKKEYYLFMEELRSKNEYGGTVQLFESKDEIISSVIDFYFNFGKFNV